MPKWLSRRNPEPEAQRYRPEYMRVQDVANHPGTAGYVRVDHSDRGGLTGFTVGSTTASNVGVSPEGQVWITGQGTITRTPVESPWAYVAHIAGEGLTVYLPDEWGEYVTLLADNPPDRWIPASPGKAPQDDKPRGISAPDDPER